LSQARVRSTTQRRRILFEMPKQCGSHWTRLWRWLDSNFRFRARAVSVLPLRDQMLASGSSSGEPDASPFSRPGHLREAADNYDCAGRGQPAPHTPSPGRKMANSRRGSYAKTKDIDLSDADYLRARARPSFTIAATTRLRSIRSSGLFCREQPSTTVQQATMRFHDAEQSRVAQASVMNQADKPPLLEQNYASRLMG